MGILTEKGGYRNIEVTDGYCSIILENTIGYSRIQKGNWEIQARIQRIQYLIVKLRNNQQFSLCFPYLSLFCFFTFSYIITKYEISQFMKNIKPFNHLNSGDHIQIVP